MDKPAQIYNCDESGSPRLLQQKGTKKVRQCTSGNKTQITILGVANAAGKVIPPMVVFSGKNWNSVWNVRFRLGGPRSFPPGFQLTFSNMLYQVD